MQIELSADEVRAVLGMLDLATKAGGLQVAQHAIPIAVKLQAALDAESKPVEAVSGDEVRS